MRGLASAGLVDFEEEEAVVGDEEPAIWESEGEEGTLALAGEWSMVTKRERREQVEIWNEARVRVREDIAPGTRR